MNILLSCSIWKYFKLQAQRSMLQARVVTRMMCQWQIHEEKKRTKRSRTKISGEAAAQICLKIRGLVDGLTLLVCVILGLSKSP